MYKLRLFVVNENEQYVFYAHWSSPLQIIRVSFCKKRIKEIKHAQICLLCEAKYNNCAYIDNKRSCSAECKNSCTSLSYE